MSDVAAMNDRGAATPKNRKSRRGRKIMALVLAVLVLLLLLSSFLIFKFLKPAGEVASAEETGGLEWVFSIYGTSTALGDQLKGPTAAAVGPDGTIWIPKPFQAEIAGFNPDGTFKTRINGGGTLTAPTAVEVGPDGTFYVAEASKDAVRVISSDDKAMGEPLKIEGPNCIAVSEEQIVIGGQGGFAIFQEDGTLVTKVGSFGKGEGQFDMVNGVAIGGDGTIFVSDQYNNRISAYEPDGTQKWLVQSGAPANQQEITNTTEPMSDARQMQLPMRLTVDGNNRLVVVDPFDFSLTVLSTKDGSFIGEYGSFGRADGEFNYPTSVDYDADRDWFVVADTMNNRIQVVRVPDSSNSTVLSAAVRALSGPLRACLVPLLLLILTLVAMAVSRARRKKRQAVSSAVLEPVETSA